MRRPALPLPSEITIPVLVPPLPSEREFPRTCSPSPLGRGCPPRRTGEGFFSVDNAAFRHQVLTAAREHGFCNQFLHHRMWIAASADHILHVTVNLPVRQSLFHRALEQGLSQHPQQTRPPLAALATALQVRAFA